MLLLENNIAELGTLKSKLNDNFDINDLGDANHFMYIVWGRAKWFLYPSKLDYLENFL